MSFNHFDSQGQAIMVDVSAKTPTLRRAVATATIRMSPATLTAILEGRTAKGDVLGVARIAGISAVKKTPDLIPLSHPLAIHAVSVDFKPNQKNGEIIVECTVTAFERTGVEMEAMVGTSMAALTVYDMCKGSEKGISISDIALLYKEGGKSGTYKREVQP